MEPKSIRMPNFLENLLIGTAEKWGKNLFITARKYYLESSFPDHYDSIRINKSVERLLDDVLIDRSIEPGDTDLIGKIWRQLYVEYLTYLGSAFVALKSCKSRDTACPFHDKDFLYEYVSKLTRAQLEKSESAQSLAKCIGIVTLDDVRLVD